MKLRKPKHSILHTTRLVSDRVKAPNLTSLAVTLRKEHFDNCKLAQDVGVVFVIERNGILIGLSCWCGVTDVFASEESTSGQIFSMKGDNLRITIFIHVFVCATHH
jgi:hypothetical protein